MSKELCQEKREERSHWRVTVLGWSAGQFLMAGVVYALQEKGIAFPVGAGDCLYAGTLLLIVLGFHSLTRA